MDALYTIFVFWPLGVYYMVRRGMNPGYTRTNWKKWVSRMRKAIDKQIDDIKRFK